MTIDEAIKQCNDVAEQNEKTARRIGWQYEGTLLDRGAKECLRFAAEHRQLAEWLKELKELKAADVKPEIHAYWIRGKEFGFKTHNPMWYCSNCGGGIRYNTTLRTYEKHKKPVEEVNCFCRKCGAKMDLEPIYEREES